MKLAKLISLLGMVAMTGVLVYGFSVGSFFNEGSQLASMPWGIVSLVDLYTGFILFSGWIIYREKSLAIALLWTLAMMGLSTYTGPRASYEHAVICILAGRCYYLGRGQSYIQSLNFNRRIVSHPR